MSDHALIEDNKRFRRSINASYTIFRHSLPQSPNMTSDENVNELGGQVPQGYSLELVATAALHFVNVSRLVYTDREEQLRLQLRVAVRTALLFLDECAQALQDRGPSTAQQATVEKELQQRGWTREDVIPYDEGVKFLTGQSRLDRAQARFQDFIQRNVFGSRPLNSAQLASEIRKKEMHGFKVQELLFLQSFFQATLPSRRKKT